MAKYELFDTIIIGAGSAGCVIANRLSQDPKRRVLLIEAGPDYPNIDQMPPDIVRGLSVATSHDWGLVSEPGVLGRPIELLRGKLTGGSSAVNVTFAVRGQPEDYDHWAELENRPWSFAEVLPRFIKLEHDLDFNNKWHGQTGPIPIQRSKDLSPIQHAFIESCIKCGYRRILDHNQPGEIGVGEAPVNTVNGVRQSTALTYLAQTRSRPNLSIKANTHAGRVIFQKQKAIAVQFGHSQRVYGDQIILSAGSYGSPGILLRSGVGDPTSLSSLEINTVLSLPGVGFSLTEHPLIAIPFSTQVKIPQDMPAFQTLLSINTADYRYHIIPAQYPSESSDQYQVDFYGGLLNPRSRGRLWISSRHPHSKPRIDLGLLTSPEDIKGLIGLVREIWRISRTNPLGGLLQPLSLNEQIIKDDTRLEQFIRREVDVFQHPVSTCRMGLDELAVVDEQGRVKGIDNLRVIDASIMPQIPSAQTNIPTIMIAEHCMEMFKSR